LNDVFEKKRRFLKNFVPKSAYEIPNSIKFDLEGNLFVRLDTGDKEFGRIVIMMTKYKENLLDRVSIFVIDGTFKIVPHGFYQLLTIQGLF
jgi:hypothetical protein